MDEWTLNDLLECSVCLERLDTSSKVLPCQHTFCKTCLEEILTTHRELRCPECRILVESSIEDLPPNVLLMRILEGMKNSGNPGEKKKVVGMSNFQKSEGATGTPDGGSPHQPSHNNVEHSKLQSGHKHKPLPVVPYAIAMYDYTSQEAGDLHFKKGAVILLNRKVDEHWYEGQLDGLIGIFPINYVQVVKPLPEQAPTCRALYNFRIANEDDEGQSLTFKKNDVIAVIRRVDENWGEGRLNDRIGIFPLAFVELNQAAEALMNKSVNSQPGPSRVAPPAPATEDSVPLLISDDSTQSSKLNLPVLSSPSTTTSSFSITPTSSSSTSSTSNSAPNSPPSSCQPPNNSNPFLPQSPLQRILQTSHITKSSHGVLPTSHIVDQQTSSSRQEVISVPLPGQSEISAFAATKGKRHSFSALTPTPHNGSNSTSTSNKQQGEKGNAESGSNNVNGRLSRHGSQRHRRSGSDYVVTAREFDRYVALFSYKPQKADELELQKGGTYHVTEFCQDGWFKGISAKTQQTGVFPGNYVTLAKKLPIVFPSPAHPCPPPCRPRSVQQVKTIKHQRLSEQQQKHAVQIQQHLQSRLELEQEQSQQLQQQPQPQSQPQQQQQQQQQQPQQQQQQLIVPPELPPRVPSPSARQAKSSSQNSSSFWNPRSEESILRQKAFTEVAATFCVTETKPKRVGAPAAATPVNAGTPTKSTEKTKDKKERSGLIKRLTTIKKSKSPPTSSTSYSMDNPVFDDAPAAAAAAAAATTTTASSASSVGSGFLQIITQSQPVHSRSGSCPSQLIHVPEIGTNHRIMSASVSARMKHRERPSVSNASFMHSTSRNADGSAIVSSAIPPAGSSHRKSNSLDAGEVRKPRQLVPPIRERFRCIVPYPPNSEYELELKVGDIIYVHKKREDGWYKGTQQRTGRTGLFPASFVETY